MMLAWVALRCFLLRLLNFRCSSVAAGRTLYHSIPIAVDTNRGLDAASTVTSRMFYSVTCVCLRIR